MRIFPSVPAAIVTGAVVMPAFMWGCQFIERTFHSQGLVLLWAIVAFLIPVLFSTGDMRYAAKRWREVGFFRPLASREDFQRFYIPAWTRMAVWFVSTAVAMLVLKAFGVDL
jgi:hypothetical protein